MLCAYAKSTIWDIIPLAERTCLQSVLVFEMVGCVCVELMSLQEHTNYECLHTYAYAYGGLVRATCMRVCKMLTRSRVHSKAI